MSTEHSLL